ncbi:MAG: diaminopimelate decarboxylase [Candidatus Omnitrophota bacterium]
MGRKALPLKLYRHEVQYRRRELYCEGVPLRKIIREVGTPVYVYSRRTILEHYRKLRRAFASLNPLICFSVKSNSNLAVLKVLAREGAGFDVVSGGELFRVLKIGADPRKIVFASVGKTAAEIRTAIQKRIFSLNVESLAELDQIEEIAGSLCVTVRAALRLNPEVEVLTHHYVQTAKPESKFGIHFEEARKIFHHHEAFPHVELHGVHIHIGSQILRSEPFIAALRKTIRFIGTLRSEGIPIDWIDIGGGLGIVYARERAQTAEEFARAILPFLKKEKLRLVLEPGRFIMGNSGLLLTNVTYVKRQRNKSFIIVDAGMNDLIRPSLYGAYHEILPVRAFAGRRRDTFDVVGPLCESGDFLARNRQLSYAFEGESLAILAAGAYGFVMSSNYNSRPRAAEVLVSGNRYAVVRRRESHKDLIRGERVPMWA